MTRSNTMGAIVTAAMIGLGIGSAMHAGQPFPLKAPAERPARRHRARQPLYRLRNRGNGMAAASRPAWLQIELKQKAKEKRARKGVKLRADYAACLGNNPCLK